MINKSNFYRRGWRVANAKQSPTCNYRYQPDVNRTTIKMENGRNNSMESLIGCIKPSATDTKMPAEQMEGTTLLCVWCCYANLFLCQLGLL